MARRKKVSPSTTVTIEVRVMTVDARIIHEQILNIKVEQFELRPSLPLPQRKNLLALPSL